MLQPRVLGLLAIVLIVHSALPVCGQPRLRSLQAVHLEIQGAVSVSGSGPIPLVDLPPGEYRIQADGLGLARARGRLECLPGNQLVTHPWSNLRSMFLPPGIAHIGGGESFRGYLLLAAATTSAFQSIRLDNALSDASDAMRTATINYNQALSSRDIADASAAVLTARAEEDDMGELRRLWVSFFALTWAGSAVEALLLTPNPGFHVGDDGDYMISVPSAGKWQAGMRSLLVPGSGQRYLGKETKGNLFSAAVFVLGASTLAAHESYLNANRSQLFAQLQYDASETAEQLKARRNSLLAAADKADDRNRLRWVLFGATLGTYLLNIFDATADRVQSPRESSLSWSVAPSAEGLRAGVSWRLP